MKVKLNGNDWYKITSDFGAIDSAHKTPHTGIDLSMPEGTEIHSPIDGVIEKVVDFGDKNIGKGIYLKTQDDETLILGHLSDIKVEVGQKVDLGDLIALSGNTGRSTGAHLHVGLKDAEGYFIDPDKYMLSVEQPNSIIIELLNLIPKEQRGVIPELFSKSDGMKIKNGVVSDGGGILSSIDSLSMFLNDVKQHGFFYAIYGDTFFNVAKNFFKQLFIDIGKFILGNADIFFLAPAIGFMFITFLLGTNRFTKYILPLWFVYFLSTFFHKMLIS